MATPVLYYGRAVFREPNATTGLVGEAVNDHLRMLSRQHPLGIESRGLHQVKPSFEGRLDADGLQWPTNDGSAFTTEERGFNVVMWRRTELGYALVSDAARGELASVAAKLKSVP
jgi:hypothetical protein